MRAAIVSAPIDVAALMSEVSAPANGAVILFVGAVREQNDGRAVSGIEYTAYEAMAQRELATILAECAERFGTPCIAAEHRIGRLDVGEASVAIAVAHAHRAQAYEASRYVIEEIKRRVPIWKREAYRDGTREWVHQGQDSARGDSPSESGQPRMAFAESGTPHPGMRP